MCLGHKLRKVSCFSFRIPRKILQFGSEMVPSPHAHVFNEEPITSESALEDSGNAGKWGLVGRSRSLVVRLRKLYQVPGS